MIRQEHIEKMQLLGRMLGTGAESISATAVNAGLEYAQRLTTDTVLRAEVKKTFNASLAARDLRNAAQVVEKYGKTPEPVKTEPEAAGTWAATHRPEKPDTRPQPAAPTPVEELPLPPFSSTLFSDELVRYGILDTQGRFTPRGRAWRDAGIRKENEPKPEPVKTDLTEFRTYFPHALTYGIVTFDRVPKSKLKIDGKLLKEVMLAEGLIDSRLYLTDKGKTWLNS